MQKNKLIIYYLLLVIISSFFIGVSVVYAGFGITPPWIENKHVVPGSTFESSIVVSQDHVNDPVKIKIDVNGDKEIKKWVVPEDGYEVTINKGENQKNIKFRISIPKNAKLGFYEGTIDFIAESNKDGEKSGQITVAVGAQAKILLNVGDKTYSDFKIMSISIPKIEEYMPLSIEMKLKNFGNVLSKPSKVAIQIWDNNHNYQLASGEFQNLTFVDPFSVGVSSGIFDIKNLKFKTGQYWADVQVYKNGKLALSNRYRFEIVPKWTLVKKPIFLLIKDFLFKTNFGLVILTFVITALLIFGGNIALKKLKERK